MADTRTATITNATFLHADNWDVVPINGDSAVIVGGSTAITDTTGVNFVDVRWSSDYTGAIASSGSELSFGVSGTMIFEHGGPSAFMTGTWANCIVAGGGAGDNMLNLAANASTAITTLTVVGGLGTVTVGAGADLTTLEVAGAESVTVDVAANVTSLANVTLDAGIVSLASNWSTKLQVSGGVCTVTGTATGGAIVIDDDGTLIHTSSGGWSDLTGWSGKFDGSNNNNPTLPTISGTNTVYGEFIADLRTPIRTWVGSAWLNQSGSALVLPPPGGTITIS